MGAHSRQICSAIGDRRLLRFRYHGLPRIVIPCAHGLLATGNEALRAHELTGGGIGPGKLFLLAEMETLEVCPERFTQPPPLYRPDDRAMRSIHCQL